MLFEDDNSWRFKCHSLATRHLLKPASLNVHLQTCQALHLDFTLCLRPKTGCRAWKFTRWNRNIKLKILNILWWSTFRVSFQRCVWFRGGAEVFSCARTLPNTLCQGWFQGLPILWPPYGKLPMLFLYHSHIFRDSYGSRMGIVWVRGPIIGGPWKSHCGTAIPHV